MSNYTELDFNSELSSNAPDEVLQVFFDAMNKVEKPESLPDHIFFYDRGYWLLLNGWSGSYNAQPRCIIIHDDESTIINVRFSTKYNYLIYEFLDWITAHMGDFNDEFIGHMIHEEDDFPLLIYTNENGTGVRFVDVRPAPSNRYIDGLKAAHKACDDWVKDAERRSNYVEGAGSIRCRKAVQDLIDKENGAPPNPQA